jgi:DNA-binding transcriptional LysR family regulator
MKPKLRSEISPPSAPGELVIGTSDHISIHRLPDVLKACITAFPKIDLKLRCHRSETILELVAKNQVDLGVITLQKTPPNITSRVIWKDPMSLVVPVGHPLTSAKRVRLKDIVQHGMILTEHATETRKMVDDVFAAQGLTPNVAMEVAYIETIKSLVRTGLGIAILPDRAVDAEVKSGALMRLRITDAAFTRNLGVVYLKDKFLSRPAVEFLALLEKAGVGVQ